MLPAGVGFVVVFALDDGHLPRGRHPRPTLGLIARRAHPVGFVGQARFYFVVVVVDDDFWVLNSGFEINGA